MTILGIIFGASGFWTLLQTIVMQLIDRRGRRKKEMEELQKSISDLADQVSKIEQQNQEQDAKTARARILMFNDELLNGTEHSKEAYDDTLAYIDEYDTFCADHPEFVNSRTVAAEQNIREAYRNHLMNRDFLGSKCS